MDRFYLFTESEKCSILQGLKDQHEVWKHVDKEPHGITDMLKRLLDELNEVI